MRLSQISIALALALTASATAQAQQFSKVVSFGDSLTDAGNVGTLSGLPAGSSFTTNPDPTYSQALSLLLGLGPQTNNSPLIAGTSAGTNYAYGGACAIANGTPITVAGVANVPTFTCTNSPGTYALPAQFTYAGLLNGSGAVIPGSADPHALYTYWAGANDIFAGAAGVVAPASPFPTNGSVIYRYLFVNGGSAANASAIVQTIAGQAGATAGGEVKLLQAAGAKTIVVFNLPDLGKTPQFIGTANANTMSGLSTIYNLQLNGSLATAGEGIIAINTYSLINEVLANPAAYGITNTTGKACPASSVACGPAASGYPTQPISSTYLFADGIHPSGLAHALLANVVYATLNAPALVSLAPETAMATAYNHNAAINDALNSEWAAGSEVGKIRGFAAVQFGQQDINATAFTPGLNGDSIDLNLGATYRLNEGATFGVAATIGNSNSDAGHWGSFDGSSILFGIFGQYEVNGLYGRVSLSGGSTDMQINRNIDLGASTRRESGSSGISQQTGALEVGYVFKADNFSHGPFAGLITNKADVEDYVEQGTSSTSMHFDSFSRDSNQSHVGYQFSGSFGSIKPYARASWVNETNSDQVFVGAGSNTLNGHFTLAGYTPSDDSFIDWNVGAAMSFGEGFDAFLSYHARSGSDQQDNSTVNLGIRKTF